MAGRVKHQPGARSTGGKGLTPESPQRFRLVAPQKIFTQPTPAGWPHAGQGQQERRRLGNKAFRPSPPQPSPRPEQDTASFPPGKPGFMSKFQVFA